MASKTSRARRLERARAERRMAKLAAQQQKRRRIQAAIGGAVALVVIAVGATWLLGGFDRKAEPVATPDCTWTVRDAVDDSVVVTGLPPTTVQKDGVRYLTVTTDQGEIRGTLDVSAAFCGVASVNFLSANQFYAQTSCDSLDTVQTLLTCGGSKTPNYQFPNENHPVGAIDEEHPATYYAKGSILLANIDENATGPQLMFVYGDASPVPPTYTLLGQVTSGMDIIESIAAAGAVDADGNETGLGSPKVGVLVTDVVVSSDPPTDPSAEPSASATS